MKTMPVALFSDKTTAEPVRQRLAQAGFEATLNDGPPLTKLWFVPRQKADVRVEVPTEQFADAEQSLLNWDAADGALHNAIRCPECGSLRVEFPQYARHSLLTNLALGFLAEIGGIEKDYYCEDCHFAWPREGSRARRARPNQAPFYFIEGVERSRAGSSLGHPIETPEHKKAA